jgi:hypothetical protein
MATDTKETKVKETAEQKWDREARERAESKARDNEKEQVRRAGMTPEELRADDAKKAAVNQAEAARWNGLTQDERNKELDDPKSAHAELLPPWQKRLPSGKVVDAREQRPIHLYATNGTSLDAGDRQEAMDFYLKYVSGESEPK